MSDTYKVASVRVDLEQDIANVAFGTGSVLGEIHVRVQKRDSAGDQAETELRRVAVEKAKAKLRELLSQDPL